MATKKRVSEDAVLKALDELEEQLEKGAIPEEMKNANGGLATEGKDLAEEVSASEGEGGTKKGLKLAGKKKVNKSDDDSDEESSPDEDGSNDDDESSEELSKGSKKVKKGGKKNKESSSDEESSGDELSKAIDDESSSEEVSKCDTKKSFRDQALGNEEIRKAVEVSDFMDGLVSQVSESVDGLRKSLREANAGQAVFNQKMAKGVVTLAKGLQRMLTSFEELQARLENTATTGGRKSVLSKSEVVGAPLDGDGKVVINHHNPAHRQLVTAELSNLVLKGQIPNTVMIGYESGYPIQDANLLKSVEAAVAGQLKKAE